MYCASACIDREFRLGRYEYGSQFLILRGSCSRTLILTFASIGSLSHHWLNRLQIKKSNKMLVSTFYRMNKKLINTENKKANFRSLSISVMIISWFNKKLIVVSQQTELILFSIQRMLPIVPIVILKYTFLKAWRNMLH